MSAIQEDIRWLANLWMPGSDAQTQANRVLADHARMVDELAERDSPTYTGSTLAIRRIAELEGKLAESRKENARMVVLNRDARHNMLRALGQSKMDMGWSWANGRAHDIATELAELRENADARADERSSDSNDLSAAVEMNENQVEQIVAMRSRITELETDLAECGTCHDEQLAVQAELEAKLAGAHESIKEHQELVAKLKGKVAEYIERNDQLIRERDEWKVDCEVEQRRRRNIRADIEAAESSTDAAVKALKEPQVLWVVVTDIGAALFDYDPHPSGGDSMRMYRGAVNPGHSSTMESVQDNRAKSATPALSPLVALLTQLPESCPVCGAGQAWVSADDDSNRSIYRCGCDLNTHGVRTDCPNLKSRFMELQAEPELPAACSNCRGETTCYSSTDMREPCFEYVRQPSAELPAPTCGNCLRWSGCDIRQCDGGVCREHLRVQPSGGDA